MRKAKRNKEGNKNVRLGLYFGLIVVFIIIISFTFKVFDSIKSSTFDANNFYSIAIFSGNNTQVISASPKENSLKKLTLVGVSTESSLQNLGVPYDVLGESDEKEPISPKSYFTKLILQKNKLDSELTIFDLIKLSIYSNKIGSSNISEDSISVEDEEIESVLSQWFMDPEIVKEGNQIEIVNTTDVTGLGNKFADLLTNAGGNIVLVRSSQENQQKSVIYFTNDSYTVNKFSKLLDIPKEQKELKSVSDIIIQIGEDRRDY